MSAKQRDLLLLALASAVLFGVRLGAHDLWNPNEPIYGEAVVEMTARGDWLLPHVNGMVFAEKPILYFWLALIVSKVMGGVSEASLRVPSVLAGIATVLGSYVLVFPYAGRARAVASAVGVATIFGVFWGARSVQMDILVTATALWVVIAVTRVIDHGANPVTGFVFAGVVAGLGFVAKGPVAWIVPGLALGAYLIATRRIDTLFRWPVLLGAGSCLLVAAPWFAVLIARGHADVVEEALLRQNFQRFLHPWDHKAPWWYYLGALWADMAPWAFLLPAGIGLRRETDGERRLALLSWVSIVTTVVFFSLSRSKRSPYVLPIAPAVAILAAEVVLAFLSGRLREKQSRWVRGIIAALGAIFSVGGLVVIVGAVVRLDPTTALSFAAFGLAASLAGGLVLLGVFRRSLRPEAPVFLAVATALVYLAAAGIALPALDAYKSARPFCEQVTSFARPGDVVASYRFWKWRAEYRYYLGRPITNFPEDKESLRAAWPGPARVVLLIEDEKLADARSVIGDVAPAIEGRVGGKAIYVFTNR